MPRYFFELTNGDSIVDEVGEEFDLVEATRACSGPGIVAQPTTACLRWASHLSRR
jgi:hypothetical protein